MILGGFGVVYVVESALTVWAWRSRDPRARHLIKRFTKDVINPLMIRFSGRSRLSAIVHHVGRRSGTPYATPVIAQSVERGAGSRRIVELGLYCSVDEVRG